MALRANALVEIAADSADDIDPKKLYWLLNSVSMELADILAIINAHGSEALNHQE